LKSDNNATAAIEQQVLATGAYKDGRAKSVGTGIRRSSPE
jgi:hypothetical protein